MLIRFLFVAFLVAGTCIGGGMLALPVETGIVGLYPSLLMLCATALFMGATGVLLLEAALWMPPDSHITSMAHHFLGDWGKRLSVLLYLFISYGSLISYFVAAGEIIQEVVLKRFHYSVGLPLIDSLLCIGAGGVIYLGLKWIGRVNTILVVGMLFSYLGLVVSGLGGIESSFFDRWAFSRGTWTLPLLLTVFSYHTMLPSLVPYLRENPHLLKRAILFGVALTLVVYSMWQVVSLGTIPVEGKDGLLHMLKEGKSVIGALQAHLGAAYVGKFGLLFGFFAIGTSFLGISFGLFDFLADALGVDKKRGHRVGLLLLALIPSMIGALLFPNAFLIPLELTGGYGDALLSGLIPISMVWIGRYYQGRHTLFPKLSNKGVLLFLILFSFVVIALQTAKLMNV